MKQTLMIIAASALATGVVLRAAPALAEQPAQAVHIVETGDLNLASEAGRRSLDRRMVIAAHDVCGRASDVDVAGKNQVRACRNSVLADGRAKTARLTAGAEQDRAILIAAR